MTPSRRRLSLWDLTFYGIVLIQPIAPVPLFGVAQQLSNGHFAAIILIAMVAMMITAVSYGRMAVIYPSAGSAYTYVGRGLNRHLGFIVGWAMFLDYLLQPLINTVWISIAMSTRYLPHVPYAVWAGLVASLLTLLNLLGIRSSARANRVLFYGMIVVVAVFFVLAVQYLIGGGGAGTLFSIQPFYDPKTFEWHRIWSATSFAALTYIGFDGITTLAEDARDPKRSILIATVLVCAFTGVFGGLEVYLAQLVWPNWHQFHDVTTAFLDVAQRVGGPWLFHAFGVILIVAAFGSGLTGALGAAKLLYGMGRDNALPRALFAHTSEGATPSYNLIIIGVLTFAGALLLGRFDNAYELSGDMLNFGAFIAFMGVNLAAFRHFARSGILGALLPLAGFVFCAAIWWNLNPIAKIVGGIWLGLGVLYLIIATRGFRRAPVAIDFTPDQQASPNSM
jgi:putrescine importer